MGIIETTEAGMKAAIEHLEEEFKHIRTGRANPSMVDSVFVEVYGARTPLKSVANVTCPEPRQMLITPFDPSNTAAIGKAIENANLGIMPVIEANVVRINIPPMDDSIRQKMVKQLHEHLEKAKVSVRNVRADSNKHVRKEKADGDIPEDVMKKLEKQIQELTDKYCKVADDLAQEKEKDVTTI